MKITRQYSWMRRDFHFDARCENCGHEIKDWSGYDDHNFYNNVIPDMKCKSCGKSSNDMGTHKTDISPRYDPNVII